MRNSGEQMIARFEQLLQHIEKKGWKTGTYNELILNK
jgi:polysaccharide deacetylase